MNLEFTMNCCAQQISLFARKIGFNNPNEKPCRNTIAALAAARLKAYGTPTDAFTLLMAVRCFKEYLRRAQQVINGPIDYPDGPAQLQISHPEVFQSAYFDESWVEVRHLSWQDIEMQCALTPCRGTRQAKEGTTLALCGGGWSKIPRRNFGLILESAYSNQNQIILPTIDATGRNPRRAACDQSSAAFAETSTSGEDLVPISWTPQPSGALARRQNSSEPTTTSLPHARISGTRPLSGT